MKKIALIILLFACCAQGATYYVDASEGSDENNGESWETPWKTIPYTWSDPRGGNTIAEGDTIYFKDGNYGVFRESTHDGGGRLFYRNNWITYKADSGHTPTLSKIGIRNEDKWGEIEHGRSYLKFEGFGIEAGVGVAYSSYFQIRDCNITGEVETYEGLYAPYLPFLSCAVSAGGCQHVVIEDNEMSRVHRGISVSGANNVTIRNNEIHYFGEDGITAPGHNMAIDRNEIYDVNVYRTTIDIYGTGSGDFNEGETIIQEGTNAEGIYSMNPSGPYLIYQTTAIKFQTAGNGGGTITGQDSGATISNITRVDKQHTDGIAMHGHSISNMVITSNIIHPGSWNGIKLATYDGGVLSNILIANNLIYNTNDYAMYIAAEPVGGSPDAQFTDISIINNTFYYGEKLHIRNSVTIENFYNNIVTRLFIDSWKDAEVVNHGNNIFGYNEDPNGQGDFIRDTETEYVLSVEDFAALFTDSANDDLTLDSESLAIDYADATYAPATDLLGNSRPYGEGDDAGAYEYGAGPPVARYLLAYKEE